MPVAEMNTNHYNDIIDEVLETGSPFRVLNTQCRPTAVTPSSTRRTYPHTTPTGTLGLHWRQESSRTVFVYYLTFLSTLRLSGVRYRRRWSFRRNYLTEP